MNKYFTADLHLGHGAIMNYCNRPFKSIERMNEVLINNINQRAKATDLIIHVGDFACYGKEKGIPGFKVKGCSYLEAIDGTVILVEGNHDRNNRVKAHVKGLTVALPLLGNATVSHYPSNDIHCPFIFDKSKLNYHICGHVHGAWKHFYDKENNVLNINVGVDVWNYQLVSIQELTSYIKKIKKEIN